MPRLFAQPSFDRVERQSMVDWVFFQVITSNSGDFRGINIAKHFEIEFMLNWEKFLFLFEELLVRDIRSFRCFPKSNSLTSPFINFSVLDSLRPKVQIKRPSKNKLGRT